MLDRNKWDEKYSGEVLETTSSDTLIHITAMMLLITLIATQMRLKDMQKINKCDIYFINVHRYKFITNLALAMQTVCCFNNF